MIGFLRKDLYSLASTYKKNLAFVFLLYTVMTLAMDVTFLLYMVIWLMGFYSLSAISLDDACGWNRYARTLPASDRQIVGARFLATLLMTALGVVFAMIVGIAGCLIRRLPLEELLFSIPVITGIALACIGLLLAAAYKWGVDKARNTFLLAFMAACLIPSLLAKRLGGLASLKDAAAWLDAQPAALSAAAALGIGLAVFAVGYLLACAVYRKKEF